MAEAVKTLLHDIGGLISLPEVVLKINEMVNSDDAGSAEIAQVISQDPAISTRILRVANSAMYGGARQVETIHTAVTLLGTKQIRDLVLSTTAAHIFDGISNDVISVEDFWHHSLYVGLLARELAHLSKKVNAETMFTAGLLHDIGHLVMFNQVPEQAQAAILRTIQGEASVDLYEAEREILGYDHAEVGASLAREWHLPEVLVHCIGYHHELQAEQDFKEAVAHIHIANVIASLPYSDIPAAEDLARIDEQAWELAGLTPDGIGEAIQKACSQITETQQAIFEQES